MASPHLEEPHVLAIPHIEAVSTEDARWLALLLDTEGSLGWTHWTQRLDRIDEKYRYEYAYYTPFVSLGMDKLESEQTVRRGAQLLHLPFYIERARPSYPPMARFSIFAGRALRIITTLKPHFDKFRRMSPLLEKLFQDRVLIRENDFRATIQRLFGKFLTSDQANPILLKMTPQQYEQLLRNI